MENCQPALSVLAKSEAELSVDFVAVPGLGKAHLDYWSSSAGGAGLSWLSEKFSAPFVGSRVSSFNYLVSDSCGGIFTRIGARRQALRLLDGLVELRKDGAESCNLVFIAHDVGGILVKEALVLAGQNPEKYANVFLHTSAIIFLGCPHRSRGTYELKRDLVKLLNPNGVGRVCESDAWAVTHGIADWIREVNSDFAESRLSIWADMVSVFSSHEDPALRRKIFDEYVATMTLPFEARLATELPHQNMACQGPDIDLTNLLKTALRSHTGDAKRCILSLASQAPPQYPLEAPIRDFKQYGGVTSRKTFQEWRKANGLQLLLLDLDTTEAAICAAEYLFHDINDSKASDCQSATCLYFGFISTDSRRNSIESMLYSCLAQTVSRFYDSKAEDDTCGAYPRMFGSLEKFLWWNRDDLLAIFIEVLLDLGVKGHDVVLVMGNLQDSIKSCDWFLTKVNKLADECDVNFKVLVTTPTGAQPGQTALWRRTTADFEAWSQHEPQACREGTVGIENDIAPSQGDKGETKSRQDQTQCVEGGYGSISTHDLDLDFVKLVQESPMSERDSTELFHSLQACNKDRYLRSMITNWHQTWYSIPYVDNPVLYIPQSTGTTPEVVFKALLSSLPLATDQFLHNILNLLLYSLRPLTVLELNDLAQCNEKKKKSLAPLESPSLSLHPRIQLALRGLVKVTHNEVQFAHPELRRYLLSDESPLKTPQWKCHQGIADLCLEYISTQSRDPVTKDWPRGRTTIAVEWRHTFLDYAVRWWPSHARLSETGRPYCTSQLLDFWNNGPLLGWARMYSELQNPFARGSITTGIPFAILASYGLSEALVLVAKQQGSSEISDDLVRLQVAQSVEAAAGNGELETALRLIEKRISPSGSWDNIILAAIQSNNQQVSMALIKFGLQDSERIRDPSLLLCRASSVGQAATVKALLPLAIERGQENATILGMTALQHASLRGNLEAAKLLVTHNDISFKTEYDETVLELACKYGQAEIVNLLATTAMSHAELADEFDDCAELAIDFGHHRTLDRLLTAFRSPELEADTILTLVMSVIAAKHTKCWDVLWKHIAAQVDPADDRYMDSLKEAMRLGFQSAYRDMLKVEGTLADGRYANFLEWGIEQGYELRAIEAIVAAGAEQCGAEDIATTLADALHLAVREHREDVVSLLVRAKAPLNKSDWRSRTPLFQAVYTQSRGIARILIEAGADLEAQDDEDWRPIHAAYDDATITRLLIQKGADINAKTKSGWTCLYYAAKWDQEEVLEALLEHRQKINPEAIQEALSAAVSKLKTRCVGRLLDAGADPRNLASHGSEELMSAVNGGAKDIVKMLLEFNLDLEKAKDVFGYTVLNRAVLITPRDSDTSVVKAFVNRGSDLESASNDGYTALCSAAWRDNLEIARYLILKGARINITGGPHGGPLIRACRVASLDMVKLLCKYGADTNIVHPGVNGTPLQAALLREPSPEKDRIIKYLLDEAEYTADANLACNWWGGPLNVAVLSGTMEVVRLLLKRGAKVDGVDKVGRQAIHYALYRSIDRVELLCQPEYGAQLFEPDKMGRGALHLAVVSGRLDLVQYVLEKAKERGLDVVNARDMDQWTPLLWAMRQCSQWEAQSHQRQAILEELLHHGADLFAEGLGLDRKWTALKLANHYGLPHSIIEFLETRGREVGAASNRDWDSSSRRARKAKACHEGYYCDACLILMVGVYYRCDQCGGFFLCFKCYRSKEIVHPGHLFTDRGEEYDYDSTEYGDSNRDESDEEREEHNSVDTGDARRGQRPVDADDARQSEWRRSP